jgi:hypothetical protein
MIVEDERRIWKRLGDKDKLRLLTDCSSETVFTMHFKTPSRLKRHFWGSYQRETEESA